jgi:hypothetical protein
MMCFSFFKRRFAAKAKVKADGSLLIDLLGDRALAMATENALKSAADGDDQNQHHSRVRTYVKKSSVSKRIKTLRRGCCMANKSVII